MTFAARAISGAFLAGAVGYGGFRARSLTGSGGAAAAIIGTVAVAAGWNWASVLLAYFVVTILLSRVGADRKRDRLAGVIEKPGARDAAQVMANGFPFLFCAAMAIIRPGGEFFLWMTCAAGSLAASAADTWSTEIGTLVGQPPRSILTWKRMTVGESGGVSPAGWGGTIAGAAFVGIIAAVAGLGSIAFAFIFLGGVTGAIVDSIVGASIQRRAWCGACSRATEMRIHVCGTATTHTGGLPWLENDGVNLIATLTGAAIPWLVITLVLRAAPAGS